MIVQRKLKEPFTRIIGPLAYLLAILMSGAHFALAQEGNYKFENFGNQSVLLNGNVTGSVADMGLVYHNPARLGLIESPSFTIGGKGYEWTQFSFDNILQTDRNLSSDQFGGIPATIAGTFDLKFLPGHKFAYSILTRFRSNIQVNYSSGIVPDTEIPAIPNATESLADLGFRDRLEDSWFGLTWAYPFSESFSVGASLFGSVYEINGRGEVLINVRRETGGVISYAQRLDYRQKTYGVQLRLGAAWIVSNLDMGVNVSLPFLGVLDRASFTYLESLGGFSPERDFVISQNFDDLQNNRRTATGISYGLGIPWKKNKLHFSLDWFAPIGSYDRIILPDQVLENLDENPFKEELSSVVNFGLGGEFYLSPSLNIIASFSSDFSATRESINLFDIINQSSEDINLLNDLWHYALGVDLTRPWGNLSLGVNYAGSSSNIGTTPETPQDPSFPQPRNITTRIKYDRWRFIVGLEIPLLLEKVKNLPIPLR